MSGKTTSPEQKGKKTKILLLIGLIVIVALVTVIIFLIMNKSEDEPKRNVVVTKDNAEEVADDMLNQEYVEPGYYTVKMETDWHFSKGDAISDNARVDNLAENTNDIYFDVFLQENETEPIYKSPVIPRGGYLENIALDASLNQGIHNCIIIYHLIDDEQATISTLRVAFTITVDS